MVSHDLPDQCELPKKGLYIGPKCVHQVHSQLNYVLLLFALGNHIQKLENLVYDPLTAVSSSGVVVRSCLTRSRQSSELPALDLQRKFNIHEQPLIIYLLYKLVSMHISYDLDFLTTVTHSDQLSPSSLI